MTTYRNIWHKPGKPEYGPEEYQTDVAPQEYKGRLIYHRQQQVWDVVENGECIGQYAGPNGARSFIDGLGEWESSN